jgi:hypothetical protein
MKMKSDFSADHFISCFWDIDISKLDLDKDYFFVIARVLEHGIFKQILLLRELYTDDQIIEVVKNSNSLSPRIARYWALYFNLPEDNIKSCTKTIQFRLRP